MHAPDLVGNVLEPCWNLPGTLLELPNTDSVGFQSLQGEVVPAKYMFRKTGTRSLAGTLLESHSWNLETDETLLEPCQNLAGESLRSCWWNLAGTFLEPR